jgi:murein DD-endopeptidase MepM/ murein hydrolase activator NlpD
VETIRPIVSESHPKDKPSIALIGLAISVGASSILLPQQTDNVRAAELMIPEFSDYSIHNPELTTEPFTVQPASQTPQTDLTPSSPTSNLPISEERIQNFSDLQDATSAVKTHSFSQPQPIVQTIVLEQTENSNDLIGRVTVITSDTDSLNESVSQPFASQNLERYQVQTGDTLSSIASIYGVTVAEIVQINRLIDANQVEAGQILNVPTLSTSQLDLVEERSPEPDRASSLSQSTSQIWQSTSTQEYQSASVKTLKADLTKLRQKYQAHKKRLADPVLTSTQTRSQLRTSLSANPQRSAAMRWQQEQKTRQTLREQSSSPATQSQPPMWEPAPVLSETQSTSVAMAPLGADSYQPHITPQIVSPDIPPLQGPEAYLPNISETLEGYIWPAQGVMTSGYGWRWGRMHAGIDIAGPIGTPVVAAGVGVVVYARWNEGGYGNLVEIQHPDGSITRYAHNDRILVHEGQRVEAGQQISEMGSTGYSTGPHLHFEIHPPGQGAQNPIAYLPVQ